VVLIFMVMDIINEINLTYPDINKVSKANNSEITIHENKLGIKLPESFKKFLKYFSNGIMLLDCEVVFGVCSANAKNTRCFLAPSKIAVNKGADCLIVPKKRTVPRDKLIAFTAASLLDMSYDHWVFIVEDGIENNEYKVGYVSEETGRIVAVLDNFEHWFNVFWDNNKDKNTYPTPVFHGLYPDLDERDKILNS
jgi:hypothetical protein